MTDTSNTQKLRDGIRAGAYVCPNRGQLCDPAMAHHAGHCQWRWAINMLYSQERLDEGIKIDTEVA